MHILFPFKNIENPIISSCGSSRSFFLLSFIATGFVASFLEEGFSGLDVEGFQKGENNNDGFNQEDNGGENVFITIFVGKTVFKNHSGVADTEDDEGSGESSCEEVGDEGGISKSSVVHDGPGKVVEDKDGDNHVSGSKVPSLVPAEQVVSVNSSERNQKVKVEQEVDVQKGVGSNKSSSVGENGDINTVNNPPPEGGFGVVFLGKPLEGVTGDPDNKEEKNTDGSENRVVENCFEIFAKSVSSGEPDGQG